MALMSIRNVTLSWGGPPLLEDITFHIEKGERIALVGRNGCGKSTLMKLLAKARIKLPVSLWVLCLHSL